MSGMKVEFDVGTGPSQAKVAFDITLNAEEKAFTSDQLDKIKAKREELLVALQADITKTDFAISALDEDKKKQLLLLQQLELALAQSEILAANSPTAQAGELDQKKEIARKVLQNVKLLRHYVIGLPYTDEKGARIDLTQDTEKQKADAVFRDHLQQSLTTTENITITPDMEEETPANTAAASTTTSDPNQPATNVEDKKADNTEDKKADNTEPTDKKAPGGAVNEKEAKKLETYRNNPFDFKNHTVMGQMFEALGSLFVQWPFQILAHYGIRLFADIKSGVLGPVYYVSGALLKCVAFPLFKFTGYNGLNEMANNLMRDGEKMEGTVPLIAKVILNVPLYGVGRFLEVVGAGGLGRSIMRFAEGNLDGDKLMGNLRNSIPSKVARWLPNIVFQPGNVVFEKTVVGVGHLCAAVGNFFMGDVDRAKDHVGGFFKAFNPFRITGSVLGSILTNVTDWPRAIAPAAPTTGTLDQMNKTYEALEEVAPNWFAEKHNIARWFMNVDLANRGTNDETKVGIAKTMWANTFGSVKTKTWRRALLVAAGLFVLPLMALGAWNKYKYGSVFGAGENNSETPPVIKTRDGSDIEQMSVRGPGDSTDSDVSVEIDGPDSDLDDTASIRSGSSSLSSNISIGVEPGSDLVDETASTVSISSSLSSTGNEEAHNASMDPNLRSRSLSISSVASEEPDASINFARNGRSPSISSVASEGSNVSINFDTRGRSPAIPSAASDVSTRSIMFSPLRDQSTEGQDPDPENMPQRLPETKGLFSRILPAFSNLRSKENQNTISFKLIREGGGGGPGGPTNTEPGTGPSHPRDSSIQF